MEAAKECRHVGEDGIRKVGWAKYYEARAEADELRWLIRILAGRVVHDPRLRVDDPVVVLAEELLRSVT